MKKRAFVVAALGLAAVLVAGGLVASNMGFKLNYLMDGPGDNGSKSGTNGLSLPYNAQTSIVDAEGLINDIETDFGNTLPCDRTPTCVINCCIVGNVSRHVRSRDIPPEFYTGLVGVNFPIIPGEGYEVAVKSSVNYIVVGSHDPSLAIVLDGPGQNGSKSGSNLWSYPYHSTATNAEDLINEINAAAGANVVALVARKVRTRDIPPEFYTGLVGVNFPLVPGEPYTIQVDPGVTWVPSHY